MRSKSRDRQAVDFGLYALIDVQHGGAVNPAIAQRLGLLLGVGRGRMVRGFSLQRAIESYLTQPGVTVPDPTAEAGYREVVGRSTDR